MKDFFISYTRVDREVAVWIAEILRNDCGCDVFLSDPEELAGTLFMTHITEELARSRHFILIASEAYFESVYATRELSMFNGIALHEKTRRIIPIKVRAVELPLDVRDLGCHDFTTLSADRQRELIQRLPEKIKLHAEDENLEQTQATPSKQRRSAHEKDFLPKNCDRGEQIKQVQGAVLEHLRYKPQRPLICVVHGHERECHTEFFKKLNEEIVPEVLRSIDNEEPNPSCCLWDVWPRWRNYQDKVAVAEAIQADVTAQSQISGIVYHQIINSRDRAVIITLTVNSGDATYISAIDLVVDHFLDIKDLPPQTLLIVIVSFRYKAARGDEKHRMNSFNAQLKAKAKELGNRKNPAATFAILDELEPITVGDARELVQRYGDYYSLEPSHVIDIYAVEESDVIHMLDLISKLWEKGGPQL
jgi:hypothetical protein